MKALALCRIGAVIFATLLAGRTVAFGQEQRGSIEGTVTDTSGGVLAGAVVEARSPALVGTGLGDDRCAGALPVSLAATWPV